MGDAGGGENAPVLLELLLTTEAVSLGGAPPFLPFVLDEGAGLADPLVFLSASHPAEPTIVPVCQQRMKIYRACYTYLVVRAQEEGSEKIFVGERGTLARLSLLLKGDHNMMSLGTGV